MGTRKRLAPYYDMQSQRRVGEDHSGQNSCVCGQPDLTFLFTIENMLNGRVLHPIGSVCVNHFQRKELNQQIAALSDLLKLRTALRSGRRPMLDSEYFTRAMLNDMYEQGVFTPDDYNQRDSERELQSVLEGRDVQALHDVAVQHTS